FIIASKRRSQSGRLDPNDRVPRRIEARVSPERIDTDGIGLQRSGSSSERALDDEGKKCPQSRAAAEDGAVQDPRQGVSDILSPGGRRDTAASPGGTRLLDGRVP